MRRIYWLAGVVLLVGVLGCGGGGDDGAGVCRECSPEFETIDECREYCQVCIDDVCFGEPDAECLRGCRRCGGGLVCGPFTTGEYRCAIDDGGTTCCNGDRMVECF